MPYIHGVFGLMFGKSWRFVIHIPPPIRIVRHLCICGEVLVYFATSCTVCRVLGTVHWKVMFAIEKQWGRLLWKVHCKAFDVLCALC